MISKKQIIIQPRGRLANQMLQLMLAIELKNRTSPDLEIIGYHLPEWGLSAPLNEVPSADRSLVLDGHSFDLDKVACALRLGLLDTVVIRGWGMRLEYHRDPLPYAELFQATDTPIHRLDDSEILIHIRGEDVLTGYHPKYFPLPMSNYEFLVENTGLSPVFIGQLDDNFYTELIHKRFPGARFLPPSSPVTDFETIRNAHHVALSISSFSWLAAWISPSLENIHMPVCGMFDPQRAKTMLLPVHDQRYSFYDVPFPSMHSRQSLNFSEYLDTDHTTRALARSDVAELCRDMLLPASKPAAIFSQTLRRDQLAP